MTNELTPEIVEINPMTEFVELMRKDLEKAHTYLHRLWNKELAGEETGWSLENIYRYHKMVLGDMRSRDIKHVSNIDTLDTTETLSDIKEITEEEISMVNFKEVLLRAGNLTIKEDIAHLLVDTFKEIENKANIVITINNIPNPITKSINFEITKRDIKNLSKNKKDRKKKKRIPYVLLNNLENIEIDTDKNSTSSLPTNWERKIPEDLKWWGIKTNKKNSIIKINKVKKLLGLSQHDQDILKIIYEMTLSRHSRREIAETVNLSKSTVYLKQKSMELQ